MLLSSAASFIFLANKGGQQEAAALARHLLGRVALLLAAPAQAQTPDTTAPTLSSATANNTTLRLTYNEALDTSSVPEATAFTVEVDRSDVSLSATSPVAVSGMAVTLTLTNGVGIGKTVKVDYTVPGSNPIQDSAGNDAGALMNRSVTVSGICDRTPAVQTAILGKISGITDCEDVTSSHLSGITGTLTLSGRNLTSLQENDFDGLSKLNFLWLNDNSLSSVHEDIFEGLSSLNVLSLSNNSLSSLPENIFNDLTSLSTLYLGENSLSSLGENIFNDLSSLSTIFLNDNGLSSLHVGIFNGLTALTHLYLQNNSLRSLPEGLLSSSRLPRLSFLRSSNNLLMCLPRDLAGRPSSIIIDNAVRDLPDCYGVSLSVSPTEVSEGSEGESITVTATLKDGNRVRSEATTVTISVEEDTAIEGEDFEGVSDFAITIASGSSSSSGTFTLTAKRDLALDDNETVKVTGRTGLSNSSVVGTEVEEAEVSIRNTPPAVELSPTSLTVEEGESGSYTVVLDTQPSGTVTITASSSDTTVATVTPPSLTFTTSNWNTAQTVTVTGVEDDDATNETVAISHGVSGYGSVSSASNVTVTVNDDETAGVSLSATDLTVNEGGSGTYAVVLDSLPSGSVTITPSSDDSGAASFSPATLIFSTSNWNTAQTVTVSGVEDDDANNETVAVSHSVRGYGSVSTASNVTVTVNDDETAGVSLSATDLTVNEGGSGTYTVVLESLPGSNVTVTASGGDSGAASFSPATLTFSTANWNTAQTVTVTGVEDDDANNETVNISHGVGGYGTVSTANGVTVTVNDDETAGVTVNPTDLTMREGESGSYTVVLDSQPSGSVTITPSSDDSGASSISPATLTFTTANWNTAQTVTVSGVEDDDANNETVAISHGVSGYGSVSSASNVTVTVNDDETAGVSLSATDLTVNEGGSGTYAVVLDSLPSGSVTITPSSDDSGAASFSPATLIFSTSNWNTAQTVTVTGVEDDDANNETVAVSHSVRGYGSVSTASNVTVTVNDDETAGVEVDPTTLTMREGQNNTYTVELDSQPSGSVTIVPSSDDSGAASISPATLIFSTSNWNTAQTVTVTGVEDDDASNETVAISHSVRGYGSVSTASNVTVTVNDDETAGVTVNPTTLTMREGQNNTYTMELESQPSGSVTITPSSGDSGAASISPATLTFTTANWNTAQTVTVTGVEDDDANNETVAVSHSVRGYGSVSSASNVTVTVNDDETAGVSLSATDLTVNEGGSGTYTVVLESLPGGNVTVTASSGDTAVATVTPPSLTFTTSDWNTPQTVRVSSVKDDDIASADERVSISHTVGGADYGAVTVADVTVTVNDDDTAGVSISPTSLTLNEGDSDIYTVVLESEPTGTVSITPSSSDGGAAMVTPASLTFTASNWTTARTVTVNAVQDDDANGETIAVSHGISGGGYGSISVPDVTVTVNDDDTAGVSISPTSLSMTEGETGTYTVVLESEPTATVTITPSSDNSDMTLSPGHLTFTATTWNTAQTITVTALQDDDNEDETVAILHSVRGYGSISSGDMVTVTVRDDDEATGEAVVRAWLPRFGRSVAQQVVERVSRRLQQRPQPGLEVSVAGEQLTNRGPWEEEEGIMAKLLGFETVSEGQLVEGTEFAFSPSRPHGEAEADGEADGEGLAFWGAGELSSFNGQQDTISLSATVTTALVAADWQSQRWQAGTALAHSWGRGSYQESSSGAEGQISSNLTGLFPYGRYALNPNLTLWGVVGHGWGRLSLLPQEGEQQGSSIEMSMAAVGLEGLILDGGGSGLTIRSRADALLLGVSSEQSQQLAGVQGEVSRLRLGLEAQRPFSMPQSDAVLTPSLALAMRQDGGDAETGFGLDLAASLVWTDPVKGMEVEVAGRSLLSHGDQSFHDQGIAASFSWDPNPSSSLGPSLSLSQSMGASASSGSDALLNPTSWPEMETSTSAGEVQQFGARMGYGLLAYRDALLITPELGVALSGDGATTTLGFSLSPYSQQGSGQPWEMVLERQHSNGNSDDPTTQHSLNLRFSLLF